MCIACFEEYGVSKRSGGKLIDKAVAIITKENPKFISNYDLDIVIDDWNIEDKDLTSNSQFCKLFKLLTVKERAEVIGICHGYI